MFTFLTLDQSTDIVGYAVFRNAKLYKYGSLKLSDTNSSKNLYAHTERRKYLVENLQQLIKQHKINYVVYEGVYASPNIETFKKLSKVQGTIEDLSCNKQLDYEEFPITQWRSYLPLNPKTKKRKDVKKAVHVYIDKLYPELKDEIEDTKESIAMGLAWIEKQNKLLDKQISS